MEVETINAFFFLAPLLGLAGSALGGLGTAATGAGMAGLGSALGSAGSALSGALGGAAGATGATGGILGATGPGMSVLGGTATAPTMASGAASQFGGMLGDIDWSKMAQGALGQMQQSGQQGAAQSQAAVQSPQQFASSDPNMQSVMNLLQNRKRLGV